MANDNMNFGVDLLPATTDTYNLGTSTKKWIINGVSSPSLTDTTYTYKDKSGITHITTNKPPKGAEIIPYNYSGSTGRFRLNKR